MNPATADARVKLAGWAVHPDLLMFARALCAAAEFDHIDHAILFFENPWNWHREYAAWESIGGPAGPGDEGWDAFVEGLNAL